MKTQHPKLKTPTRPLFSCGFFRYCTQTVLSPTTPITPTLPPPLPQLPPATDTLPSRPHPESESSSSSSSTSQSFTQWRFPLPQSPVLQHQPTSQFEFYSQNPQESTSSDLPPPPPPLPVLSSNLVELFHMAEVQFSTGSDGDRLYALHLLEHSLVAKPTMEGGGDRACPPAVMNGLVGFLKDPAEAKSATKVLLALCLAEGNRHVAVEAGAVAEVVETVAGMEGSVAERALAALDLLCTLPEGAAELRSHALAVPMLVEMMGKVAGRGMECAISVLAVIFGGGGGGGGGDGGGNEGVAAAQTEDVRRAVMVALQGKCSARGRRKGSQLLKFLQLHDNDNGRLDYTEEGQ
ncbi:U-box domain-containing protein 26 [Macadamia integrifolia]|uniref:U-box domain-containing protein 26 n=1 Tax=Macadamia integrifolia TaxID=60698 RepID=UPI001C4E980A|nr:U-box domain-containing protein 26 [Macadamia integrifolia]